MSRLATMTASFADKKLAIPHGSTVLITGVTGLIGSHVANQLLLAGFKVRGTTRSAPKGKWLTELFDKQYGSGKFELVELSDMTESQAWTGVISGVTGIAHVASDLSFGPDPNQVVTPTVATVVALLSAATHEPSVARVVYTSSSMAITAPEPNTKATIDISMWNTSAVEAAWKPPPYDNAGRVWDVYGASKTQAEQAAWKFMDDQKPAFVLNTVLPNTNFGQIISPKDQAGSTAGMLRAIFESGKVGGFAAGLQPQWYIDVEDTARLHVAALIDPDVRGQRILGFAEPFNWEDVLTILRASYPGKTFEFDNEGKEGRDLNELDNEPGAALLRKWFNRPGWTPLEESVKRNVACL